MMTNAIPAELVTNLFYSEAAKAWTVGVVDSATGLLSRVSEFPTIEAAAAYAAAIESEILPELLAAVSRGESIVARDLAVSLYRKSGGAALRPVGSAR